ncbi:TonB-dependent receptor domain-containing protein [Dokdonella soli]|uniref:TonB-dependent receptor n=1 Tax=Dokdonella soli TaxID=529810 RepID=A0ABN1IHR8_9GAMM
MFTIDRAQIEKQGFATVEDIINHLSSAGTASVNRSTVLVSNTYGGGSFVDMRNLGVVRTLVLVDGRRWGTDVNGRTDLATIPVSIIERVEVLKDGASALYGSDAIAGVVNIVTRKQFDGLQASGYVGQYDQGDGTTQSYDLTLGNTTEKSMLVFDASYQKVDPVWARDRDFSKYPFGPNHMNVGTSPVGPGGVLVNGPTGGGGSSGRQWKLNPGADPTNFANYHPLSEGDYYNTNVQQMLAIGSERKAIFAKGRYDFLPGLAFRADALYDERVSNTQVAGYPLQGNSFGIVIDKDSYYNPLGSQHGYATPQSLQFTRRITDVPRVTDNNLKTYHFATGLEGYFELIGHTYNWDVNYLYNKIDGVKHLTGNLNLINVKQALGPFLDTDGKVKCGKPGAVIAGCVPWNVLAGQGQYGADALNYVLADIQDTYSATTKDYSANITGDLFELPAGALAFAAGYESRHESGYFRPDALSSTGNTTNNAAQPTNGKYSVDEFYVELSVPVLKDLPFAKSLDLSVAGRHSDYGNFGTTTNGKFGLTWRPIEDLLARGSYSEGFRAPTINDLFGGTSQTFDQYLDPCDAKYGLAATDAATAAACGRAGLASTFRQTDAAGNPIKSGGGAQSTTAFLSGSNRNLKPETSTSKTLGLVYSPSYLPGFDISLDWYRIRIQNLVSGVSANTILKDCYQGGDASACSRFQRNPTTGQVINLNRSLGNTGWEETDGYDLAMNYRLPETVFGLFKLSMDANYISSFSHQTNPSAKVIQDNGWYPVWRIRANTGVDWTYGDWGATWGLRYYSSFKDACRFDQSGGPECSMPNYVSPGTGKQPATRIGSVSFNDLQVHYNLPWKGVVAVGANNVFDRVGPMVYGANGNLSQYSYHPSYDIGRLWYVKYSQKF